MNFADQSFLVLSAVFLVCVVLILIAGTKITRTAEKIADYTKIGQAVTGIVFLGASTSIAGMVLSAQSAYEGHVELSISNAIGGIAVQTLFIAVGDCFYRTANLEYSAASQENLVQAVILIIMLNLPLLGFVSSDMAVGHIHFVSFAIIAVYLLGLKVVSQSFKNPTWYVKPAVKKEKEKPDKNKKNSEREGYKTLFSKYFLLAGILAVAGYFLSKSAVPLSSDLGISKSIMGTFLTSVSTSLPELVTTLAAVRNKSLTLAIGGIIGGNIFDCIFLSVSDFFYLSGTIFAQITPFQIFTIILAVLMTSVLLLGLLIREKYGPGKIGLESISIILIYIIGMGTAVVQYN